MKGSFTDTIILTRTSLALASVAAALNVQQVALVHEVEHEPLAAQTRRLFAPMGCLGDPFSAQELTALRAAMLAEHPDEGVAEIQSILDARCLFGVNIQPSIQVEMTQGPAKPVLVEKGWRQFLVKVVNETGTATALAIEIRFDVAIERSSWVALRIFSSSLTNPIFVLVGDQPIRASRQSIESRLQGVDQCLLPKERFIAEDELPQAKAAYVHARQVYRQRLAECAVD